jgi:asparagine synthetase B (glutamine-hydrolysing)
LDIPAVAPWFDRDYARRMDLDGRDRRLYGPRGRSVADQGFLERIWPVMLMGTGSHQTVTAFEYRYPLLYRPLVEFMFAIPLEQRLRPGEDRSLQRRALKGILPERVRTRTGKMGPQRLYHDGLRDSPAWIEALTDHPRVAERGYVDRTAWEQAIAQMTVGRTHGLLHFLGTATLELWLRRIETLPAQDSMASDGNTTVSATL